MRISQDRKLNLANFEGVGRISFCYLGITILIKMLFLMGSVDPLSESGSEIVPLSHFLSYWWCFKYIFFCRKCFYQSDKITCSLRVNRLFCFESVLWLAVLWAASIKNINIGNVAGFENNYNKSVDFMIAYLWNVN